MDRRPTTANKYSELKHMNWTGLLLDFNKYCKYYVCLFPQLRLIAINQITAIPRMHFCQVILLLSPCMTHFPAVDINCFIKTLAYLSMFLKDFDCHWNILSRQTLRLVLSWYGFAAKSLTIEMVISIYWANDLQIRYLCWICPFRFYL